VCVLVCACVCVCVRACMCVVCVNEKGIQAGSSIGLLIVLRVLTPLNEQFKSGWGCPHLLLLLVLLRGLDYGVLLDLVLLLVLCAQQAPRNIC